MYKLLSRCPVCSNKLKAIKLKCTSCNTVIENEFQLSKFDYLNKEQLNFIEVFIKYFQLRILFYTIKKEYCIAIPFFNYVKYFTAIVIIIGNVAIINTIDCTTVLVAYLGLQLYFI